MVWLIFFFGIVINGCVGVWVNNTYDLVKFVEEGERFKVTNMLTNSCHVVINNNGFDYEPGSKNVFENIQVNSRDCGVTVKARVNDTGIWTFDQTSAEGVRLFVHVTKQLTSKSLDYNANTIKAFENDYIIPRVPVILDNHTSCYLVHDSRGYVYNLSEENNKFELVHQCGVRLKVTNETAGPWTLYATRGNELTVATHFELILKQRNKNQFRNEQIYRGTLNYILQSIAEFVSYCIVKDPHGNVVSQKSNSKCDHVIPVVTSYHTGVWIFQYYLQNSLFPIDYKINVSLRDVPKLNTNVTFHEGKLILMCNATNYFKIKTCKFQNTNNEVINVFVGMVNEMYEYYGEGFGEKHKSQECGIVVHKPESNIGTWKCFLTDENMKTANSLIHVNKPWNFEASKDSPAKIYAIKDHSTKINCLANSRLSYCWLKSPNGTVYNVVDSKSSSPNTLLYEGSGLDMGECGAILPNVTSSSDHGDWSCHMGISDGSEVKTDIAVIVTDSIVVPVKERIKILPTDKTITMSCMAIPGKHFDNRYCRWINPNSGLFLATDYDNNNYNITGNLTTCTLVIQDSYLYKYNGRWTCVVTVNNERKQAFIDIYYETKVLSWIVIIASVLLVLIFATFSTYFLFSMIKSKFFDDKIQLIHNVETISNYNVCKEKV